MKRILVPTTSGSDWKRLLAKPELHWKPGKSAMSAAACWEKAGDRLPPEVASCLALAGSPRLEELELLLAVPEWETPLPGGDTSSHTDVLALARNDLGLVVVAVEAKVDEVFGPTLGEKRRDMSAGQEERIDFLHSVLGLQASLGDDCRYQLLHRTASAVLTARAFHAATAVMLVQSFSPEGRWFEEFEAFASAIGAETNGRPTPVPGVASPELFVGWCKGDLVHTQTDLRAGLTKS